jgi:hypothetical protein
MHKVLIFEGPLFTIFETKLKSNLSSQSAVPPFLHHSLLLRSVNNFLIHLSLSALKSFFSPLFSWHHCIRYDCFSILFCHAI